MNNNIDKLDHNCGTPGLTTSILTLKPVGALICLVFMFTVAACGGSGPDPDSGNPPDDDTATTPGDTDTPGDPTPNPVDTPSDDGQNTASFTVSGTLTTNDVFQVDSDLNDPVTSATGNNTFATAQAIQNPAIVKGYVTATATGVSPDRFMDTDDKLDFFRFTALKSQSILMEIADFDSDNATTIDLDIKLYSLSGTLLESSLSVANSFESLLIPSDGEYLLAVEAYSGGSNYTLTISTEFATTNFSSQTSTTNLRLDQLAMTDKPVSFNNIAFTQAMRNDARGLKKSTSKTSGVVVDLDQAKMADFLNGAQNNNAMYSGARQKPGLSTQPMGSVAPQDTKELNSTSLLKMIKTMNSREGRDIFTPLDYPTTLQESATDPVPDRFLQWNLFDIGWNEAQEQLQNITLQKRPVIAVIDSGLFVNHPDLNGVLLDQRDFVSPVFDGDGFVADASEDVVVNDNPLCHLFHGTHVATTALAPQNSIGITGVAPGAGLIGIKVGHNVTTELCGAIVGDVSNAILYAAGLPNSSGSVPSTPADVINLSLGGRLQSPAITSAIQQAVAQGVIVVAAAGNDGAPVASFPAATENVIAVAATDALEQKAFYSSFYPQVDIAAPGGDVTADQNGDGFNDGVIAGIAAVDGLDFKSTWAGYHGTSMASPTVAGGIALMKGIAPELTQDDIEAMLAAGDLTVDIGTTGFDNETGFGLMSLPRMIESAVQFSGGGGTGANPDAATVTTSTPASLDFGPTLNQITLNLVRLGNDAVSVVSLEGSDTLLLPDGTFPVTFNGPGTTDGFGEYTFVLDRSTLSAGAISGTISFSLSDGSTYIVPVSAINQVSQGLATTGAIFFIIERLNSEGVFENTNEDVVFSDGVSGQVITSPGLAEGNYRFVFGTDADNDFFICDQGELCGTLPFNNFGFDSSFPLNRNLAEANFFLQDVANVALSSFDGTSLPAIQARAVSKPLLDNR